MPEMIVLSKENWWEDLEKIHLPPELVLLLREAITNLDQPTATPEIIALAKEHLSGGISIGSDMYDLMLLDMNKPECGNFFVLAPKWQGYKLKYLSDC